MMTFRTKTDPRPMSTALNKVLGELGLKKALSRHSVIHKWPRLVDSVIAKHAKIDRISADTVFVIVDSAVWMSELSAIRLKLLDKLNSALEPGAAPFKEIRFTLRSWARTPESNPKPQPVIPPPDEKQQRLVKQILTPLKDQSLREMVNRIMEKDRRLKEMRKTLPVNSDKIS
jgi:hypothetical protein